MGAGGGSGDNAGVRFPKNPGQTKHIFRDDEGHLSKDSHVNRKLFLDVANNKSNYRGTDNKGVDWYDLINPDGTQVWVRVRDGMIRDAGVNKVPKIWDDETGYNRNSARK
jgi:hypothetical protein